MAEKLTRKDFPLKCSDVVIAAFANEKKVNQAARAIIDGLLSAVVDEQIDPWETLINELGDRDFREFHEQLIQDGLAMTFSHITGRLVIGPRKR